MGGTYALRNWARCLIDWNVVLDENGNPNIGPFRLRGMTTIHSQSKEFTRGPNYWVTRHFNQAARRSAKVVDSQGDIAGVGHVAFVNPDGGKTLVLSNAGADRAVQVRVGSAMCKVSLPADSMTNLSWT